MSYSLYWGLECGFSTKKTVEICFAYQPISGFIRNNLSTDPVIPKREAVGNLNELGLNCSIRMSLGTAV